MTNLGHPTESHIATPTSSANNKAIALTDIDALTLRSICIEAIIDKGVQAGLLRFSCLRPFSGVGDDHPTEITGTRAHFRDVLGSPAQRTVFEDAIFVKKQLRSWRPDELINKAIEVSVLQVGYDGNLVCTIPHQDFSLSRRFISGQLESPSSIEWRNWFENAIIAKEPVNKK
jgi:hypothetical protein